MKSKGKEKILNSWAIGEEKKKVGGGGINECRMNK